MQKTSNAPGARNYNPCVETLDAEALRDLQWLRLRRWLENLSHGNPYYARKWRDAGVDLARLRSIADFQENVPLTTKEEFVEDQSTQPPFGDRLGVRREELAGLHLTSGTSGKGREVYGLTSADLRYLGECWAYGMHWAGVRPGDMVVNLFPNGTYAAGSSLHHGLVQLGAVPLSVAMTMDTDGVISLLDRFRPQGMVVTPPYLTRLVAELAERNRDLEAVFDSLTFVMVATEAYPVEWGTELEKRLGVVLHEMYGSTQQGTALMTSCEAGAVPGAARGVLHCLDQYSLVEVLDPDRGVPVAPGEWGELVLTTFTRQASPVVRFATRDRVRYLGRGCPCGRGLTAIEAGTIGRYDDMLKIKGVNIWPSAVDAVVLTHPDVAEYSASVWVDGQGREECAVFLALNEVLGQERVDGLCAEIERRVKDATGLRFLVEVAPERVKTFEFKSRRWVDERQEGLRTNAQAL